MPSQFALADYDKAVEFVRSRVDRQPTIGLVLGSGLSPLADAIRDRTAIPFADIPFFPTSTVTGHTGRLLLGELAGKSVVAMQGRTHLYEGYSPAEITFPIRVFARLGVKTLILTNAAGGLNPNFHAGDLMLIVDHINFVGMAGHNPLVGKNLDELGPRFPSMTEAYAQPLRRLALNVAGSLNLSLRQGVYACVAGPNFETPAEVRFLRLVGADAVGMSTVPEALVAVHAGMGVLGISTITNEAVDQLDSEMETSHEEVLETGRIVVPQLIRLLNGILQQL